jgi:serine protein kinase
MRVYDGENIKETDPAPKSVQEYRDDAGVDEGMNGVSTRFAFKILSKAFNYDSDEVAPIRYTSCGARRCHPSRAVPGTDTEKQVSEFHQGTSLFRNTPSSSATKSRQPISNRMTTSDRTCSTAMWTMPIAWIEDHRLQGPRYRQPVQPRALNNELEKIEKAAGIANPKDFRNEVVNFVLRKRVPGRRGPEPLEWTSLREAARRHREADVRLGRGASAGDLASAAKQDSETEKKHEDFVERMVLPRATRPGKSAALWIGISKSG